ncbi:hypothetical protein Bbelb_265230 [Branchiostoma belcheri]|nr:hypothetical protein Bbelb_265230 [Branchiostoma belcheri]
MSRNVPDTTRDGTRVSPVHSPMIHHYTTRRHAIYSSGDCCLNLTREDWTRPGDLKTKEEYQLTAVMILNPTRPDIRVLRNLVTCNFSPVQTSKSDDLKTQCVLTVSCPDWEKPVMNSDSCRNQTR